MKSNLQEFYEKFPNQTHILNNGKSFTYRYYKNSNSKATLLLLTGGIGLSDLLFSHFDKFSKEYSVLVFDYQIHLSTIKELIDSISELLRFLNEKVWLVGQSLGGIISQIFAKQYPDQVEGMIISNSCSLPKDMKPESYECLSKMLKAQQSFKTILKFIPFSIVRILIKNSIKKMSKDCYTEEEKSIFKDFYELTDKQLKKEFENHMIDLLINTEQYMDMVPNDFKKWDDKVLLILSEDDETFNESCKKELVSIMSNPTVETKLTGGHLALVVKCEEYIKVVSGYINKRI
ncbi:hydrolase, alpha/beta domain protein [Piromyces finnis]|uniref:Hydrolase, alpha/beta domain protein n=1 Tax=Piromyces finnis TaxID=1754191 RepID=A0A1Y1VHA9_9FUNG|nr:hydrolase, alpha/beta domain protein [Piromyces finnis]|eukprot:ORX55463.1 hydrolase, alpha/beta domain protein [Piromyces finnis]